MNRQHQRSLSSASIDNKAFREAVAKMRNDVLDSQAETQRIRDQLNCLIMLVRRAWTGDQAAAVHVSNIVGVPPPAALLKTESDDAHTQGKTGAVHHWAILTMGLLNKHYKQLDQAGLALAKAKLQHRQQYLDRQLECHRDLLRKTRVMSAPASRTTQQANGRVGRENAPRGTEKVSQPGTLVEFLYPGTTLDRQVKPSKQSRQTTRRYSQPGLFDSTAVVEKPKRPFSAIHQHKTDSQRARPKSAVRNVNVKGERPLKFETTRPVSARNTSTTFITNPPSSQPNSTASNAPARKARAHSAKAFIGINSDQMYLNSRQQQQQAGPSPAGGDDQDWPESSGHVSPFRDGVSQDLRKIELMEQDFRKTAAMLQQKLGISSDGAV